MKRTALLIATLIHLSLALANNYDFLFRHYSAYDGLWSNAVRAVMQDRKGYIWIGADAGLNRFDGISMQQFNIGRNSISQPVTALLEMGDSIFIGTFNGAYVLKPSTEEMTPFDIKADDGTNIKSQVMSIASDKDGGVWFATLGQGVYRYQMSNNTLKRYYSWNEGRIGQVYVDSKNQVWAVTSWQDNGLWLFNRSKKCFEPFLIDKQKAPSGIAMTETSNGQLWLGTWTDGLISFDREGRSLSRRLQAGDANHAIHIHSITEYKPGVLLLGCDNGLILTDTNSNFSHTYAKDELNPYSISGAFVYPVFIDNEGGIWVGTFYSGLNYVSPSAGRFKSYRHSRLKNSVHGNVIGRFCEDNDHNIWIASDDGGLNKFNPSTGIFEHFAIGSGNLDDNNIHALCIDGNNLWIGTYTGGVYVLDINTGKQRNYLTVKGDENSLYDNSSYAIFKDSHANIWVTTVDGITLYQPKTDNFKRIKFIGDIIVDIDEDKNGHLWFSTQGKGIFRFDTKSGKWRNYVSPELPDNIVNCIHIDKDNNIWVATNNGLLRYDNAKDIFEIVDIGEQTFVEGIVEDEGVLWITTYKGLIKYVEGEQPTIFNTNDGLNSNQFLSNAAILASDGQVYVGTVNGFNTFYPYQIKKNTVVPRTAITGLEVMNKPIHVGDERLARSLDYVDVVNLSYLDKMFSISFASLSYCVPQKNCYAYQLEGFDKAWNYIENQTRVTYTNLSPGEYKFRVKGTNNDGSWSKEEAVLRIVIHPPFYWSIPAKILYTLLLFALFFLVIYKSVSRERKRQELKMRKLNEEKETEMRNSKIQFFTMVAHEIRTPVSLIIGPLENLMKTKATLSPSERNNLNIIDRNAHRLLDLVNQLLDFRKVEKQTYVMNFKVQNVSAMIRAVSERFEPTFTQNGVKFVTEYPESHFTAILDCEAVTKVISNLLTNARKYTCDYVRLSCLVAPDENHFIIEVEDNGVGINKTDLERIFEDFYQAADNKPGTGIGLSIVKNIVNKHQGTVEVKSQPGHGSTFIVTLPVRQEMSIEGRGEKVEGRDYQIASNQGSDYSLPSTLLPLPSQKSLTPQDTILLVDDNDDMLQYLESNIAQNYKVITAHDGIEALDKLQKNDISLIICDWMMPRMDGTEFCRHVRANSDTSHIPFIMLTAKTDIDSKAEGMNVGVDAYIEKPFSMKYLEACYRNIMSLRQMLRQRYSSTPLEPITEIAQSPIDKELLLKMQEIIEANFANPDLSINFLADKLCISRSSLFSKIKTLADMTPNEMIQTVRLKKAAQLLREGNHKVSEVCYAVGFSNPSYFSKCFQKQFGIKPTEI